MARYFEPAKEQEEGWAAWVAERPENVRKVAERFNPWTLYRMKEASGNRVTLVSFGEHEDGSVTLTVNVTGEFNSVVFDRQVFGIKPESLEECDLPATGEPLGALFTEPTDIDSVVSEVRKQVHGDRS